jgi:hypothetical protein
VGDPVDVKAFDCVASTSAGVGGGKLLFPPLHGMRPRFRLAFGGLMVTQS